MTCSHCPKIWQKEKFALDLKYYIPGCWNELCTFHGAETTTRNIDEVAKVQNKIDSRTEFEGGIKITQGIWDCYANNGIGCEIIKEYYILSLKYLTKTDSVILLTHPLEIVREFAKQHRNNNV